MPIDGPFAFAADGVTGAASSQQLALQITALNTAFASANFNFNLASAATITNRDWSFLDVYSPAANTMKAALRTGTVKDLNVYITHINSNGERTGCPACFGTRLTVS